MILHHLRTGTLRVSSSGKTVPEDVEPCSEMGTFIKLLAPGPLIWDQTQNSGGVTVNRPIECPMEG